MAGPTLEVSAPTRAPREGGIEDVAEFVHNERLATVQGIVFVSDGCNFPELYEGLCYATDPAVPDEKTFDGIEIEDGGIPFTLYSGVECFMNGGTYEEFAARARAAFDMGHGREIENQLGLWADGATAITTPVATGVTAAIGRIQQDLDDRYVGRGVILISRFDANAALAAGALDHEGEFLRTKLKTPVIASGRIAPGTVYGLGAVKVEHTEVVAREVDDPTTNRRYALAEAVFALVVDCEFRTKTTIS